MRSPSFVRKLWCQSGVMGQQSSWACC